MSDTAEDGAVAVRHVYRLMPALTKHVKRWVSAAGFAAGVSMPRRRTSRTSFRS
jgi:hypothetical protein